MLNRRSFIGGLIAAPAIVKFANIMPVRGIITDIANTYVIKRPTLGELYGFGLARLKIEGTQVQYDYLPIQYEDLFQS